MISRRFRSNAGAPAALGYLLPGTYNVQMVSMPMLIAEKSDLLRRILTAAKKPGVLVA